MRPAEKGSHHIIKVISYHRLYLCFLYQKRTERREWFRAINI